MHTAAWCCGYPIDSSGLETGKAGTVVTVLSLHHHLTSACSITACCSRPALSLQASQTSHNVAC